MQINITGHHMDVTPPLRDFTTKKFDKLQRHFDRIISIDVTFEVEKLLKIAKATIFMSGAKLYADSKSDDMYSAIDTLVDKLDRQIKEHKDKLKEHKAKDLE